MVSEWAVNVPEMAMLLKADWAEPLTVVLPLKTTAPELWVKVPLFAKLPATLSVPVGAVRAPEIVIPLKMVAPAPLIAELPLKTTVQSCG